MAFNELIIDNEAIIDYKGIPNSGPIETTGLSLGMTDELLLIEDEFIQGRIDIGLLIPLDSTDDSYLMSIQLLKKQCSALIAREDLPEKGSSDYIPFFNNVHYLEHHYVSGGSDISVTQTRSIFMAYPPKW